MEAEKAWPGILRSRQLGEGTDRLPFLCFSACDNAYLEAQRTGKTSELCQFGSIYPRTLNDCRSCISMETDDSYYQVVDKAYLKLNFQPWIDYCRALLAVTGSTGVGQPANTIVEYSADYFETLTKTIWKQTTLNNDFVSSFQETVTQILPKLMFFNTTVTDESTSTSTNNATTTSLSLTSTSVAATQSASELEINVDGETSSGPLDRSALIGVIVGSAIGGLLLLGAIAFLIRHRRKKTHPPIKRRCGKAQLHSDSLPIKPKTPPQKLPDPGLRELPLDSGSTELPISLSSKELHGSPGLPRYELNDAAAHLEQKEDGVRQNMF
ncbi:hypothetical protein QBC36DRAFT_371384 [Triangularia setosa]|uniref:Uncharacterized protein n=1 Tax=Triangularia setosa TaxID=2587417 RepID=A0AAN6WGN5_9PEZI|nr:hypothetical protein QBC36DRAFT_371384 [Podospora setosa]